MQKREIYAINDSLPACDSITVDFRSFKIQQFNTLQLFFFKIGCRDAFRYEADAIGREQVGNEFRAVVDFKTELVMGRKEFFDEKPDLLQSKRAV